MTKLGIAGADRREADTLADRLRDDAVANRAVLWTPSFVGACARTCR